MARPRLCRRVFFEPNTTYFKPAGVRMVDLEESVLTIDEFESIRLKDLEGMDQEKAAKKMNISQPTFHRLVLGARKKIADAIVNGKAIKIKGGNFKMVRPKMGRGLGFGGPASTCVCSNPDCDYKETKVRGIRCIDKKCPRCGSPMIRGE